MNTIDGELNDLLYDVGLTFLPKDCAMVGDTLISPPRKRTMKEDTAKEYAEAIRAALAGTPRQRLAQRLMRALRHTGRSQNASGDPKRKANT